MIRNVRKTLDLARRSLLSRLGGNTRRQLAIKDGEISALRHQLSLAKGDEGTTLSQGIPVFFVLGYQKSGTTWLMRMLDAHPEILCRGEGRFFDGGWRQQNLKREGVERPPSSLYHALLDAEYLRLWIEHSVWSRDEPADEHLDNLTRMAVNYFLQGELLKTSKKMVGDKSPLLTPRTIEEIARIHPESRVIHIIRDGRDAAVSAAHHTWNFGNLEKSPEMLRKRTAYFADPAGFRSSGESMFSEWQIQKLAEDWNSRVGSATRSGPKLLGDNYVEVRYEALVDRPENELERLVKFLGAESRPKTIQRCVESTSFEKLSKGRERGREDPTSFFRKGVVGDWRNVFTDDDLTIFERGAGELLTKLEYERGRQPPTSTATR